MAFPVRNTQWSGVDVQLVTASTGAAFVGTVTVFVNGDETGQVIGQNNSGLCVSDGNGSFHYVPTVAETNYAKVAFTFTGTGAVDRTISIATISATEQATVSAAAAPGGFPIRNTAWRGIDAQMISASTGGAFIGTVTCYVNGDETGQVLGQVGGGVCVSDGNGAYHYVPAVSETNYTKIAFTFIGLGAVNQMVQIATVPGQPPSTLTTGQMSVQGIVRNALRRINVIQSGQTNIDGGLLSDGFTFLNLMMDAWQRDRLTKPYMQATYANLNAVKGVPGNPYTVGPGGDFNLIRPTQIEHMNFQDNSQNPPLERPLTALTNDAYAAIPLKTLTNTLPGAFYYQPSYTNSLGSIYLWMIPTQSNLQGVLYTRAPIPQFATLNDVVILPPAYCFAIIDNLAVICASTLREGIPPDPMLIQNAAMLKAELKRGNIEFMDLSVDPALTTRRGVYNIFSDSVTGRP